MASEIIVNIDLADEIKASIEDTQELTVVVTGGGGGGVTDHSQLTNLDYDSSGHTGFERAGSAANALANANSYTDSAINTVQGNLTTHLNETTNPHATTTDQEFSDAKITDLSSEATYSGSVWSYLVGLFTSVPKSIKEHIVKIWEQIFDISSGIPYQNYAVDVKSLSSGEYFNMAVVTTAQGNSTLIFNAIILFPLAVNSDIRISELSFRIHTGATGSIRVGIYEGNPFFPYTLLYQSDEISTSVAELKTVSCDITLQKNKMYWLFYITNSSTVKLYIFQHYQIRALDGIIGTSATNNNSLRINYTYGSVPSTLEGLTIVKNFGYVPVINLKKY